MYGSVFAGVIFNTHSSIHNSEDVGIIFNTHKSWEYPYRGTIYPSRRHIAEGMGAIFSTRKSFVCIRLCVIFHTLTGANNDTLVFCATDISVGVKNNTISQANWPRQRC